MNHVVRVIASGWWLREDGIDHVAVFMLVQNGRYRFGIVRVAALMVIGFDTGAVCTECTDG